MKESTRNYLVIAALFVAVFALVTVKNLKTQKHMETLVKGITDDSVVGQGQPVLLELGSHSCVPCQKMMPVLDDLSKTQDDFVVSFVDVWAVEGKSAQYGIQAIPTQIFFDKTGTELYRHTGFYGKDEILAKWKELLAK